jgi:outer membrane protein W
MKKILLATFVLAMSFSAKTFAQDGGTAFTKGSSTVSVGYGFANIWKTLFKVAAGFGGTSTVKSTGPIALGYEYGVADKISAGVVLGYTKITNDDVSGTFKSTETLSNFSAMARVNYHFGKGPKFDPYIGLGLGYYNFKYSYKDNDNITDVTTFKVPGGFGFSGQLGAKYYFTSNIGAYMEVGYVGGSLAQIGLTAKF